jgi:hypothetical protein
MNTIGVLLLAAASATGQDPLGGAHVGGMRLFRPHVVRSGPPPASGMIAPGSASGAPGQPGRRFPNVRSQVFFVDPPGMKIGWQTAAGTERVYLPAQLTVPARYNFTQGYIYRLKLTDIPGRPGLTLYPTIEVAPSTPATDAYLTHNPIPAQFTEEDFDQIHSGNFVTKVIYLPDPKYQELASNVETLISTRLEPGVDPILEADRRGTILMIVRLGSIDLEMPAGGASVAPSSAPTGPGAGAALPPGALPGGAAFPPQGPQVVPLDTAPVSPAAPTTPQTNPEAAPAPDAKPEDPKPTAGLGNVPPVVAGPVVEAPRS